jgi:ribulose bisphosphate carboxylase small subunit
MQETNLTHPQTKSWLNWGAAKAEDAKDAVETRVVESRFALRAVASQHP